MRYLIKLSSAAVLDLKDAFDYYEMKSAGIGDKFLDEADYCFNKIANTPGIGSLRYGNVRCVLIQRFPYLIHYSVNTSISTIIIYRILNTNRKPLW